MDGQTDWRDTLDLAPLIR